MRLTVGPLPPAVYWRRRAMVLGVLLLFVFVVVYSCSKSEKLPAANPDASGSPKAPATVLTPTSESPTSEPPADGATGDDLPAAAPTEAPALPDTVCADTEISVIPVPAQNPVTRGVTIELRLRIKNISNRTCDRDVGADMQELYIAVGAQKVWSSDVCGTAKGSNVQSFPPGQEHEYRVAWNGKASTSCDNGVATGETPAAGEYQLFGRLGTKLSEPVKLTIVD